MKKLSLIKLTLTNFKGCGSFTFSPDGKNCSVFGDNGTFKTTLYDSITWLFFGKDSQFNTAFEIKTLGADNQPIHNLEHIVEGIFDLDGQRIVLKKIYSEQWTKPRGSTTKILSGHNTDHFINEVPCKLGEYKAKIAEIASEQDFKLLTSPFYFPSVMKWQDRRAMLISLCGDVPDQVVIDGNPDLAPLSEVLKTRSIENHKLVLGEKKKEVSKKLAPIEAKLSENAITLSASAGINHMAEIEKCNSLGKELDMLATTVKDLRAGDGSVEIRKQLADAENSLYRATIEHGNRLQAVQFDQREALNGLNIALDISRQDISRLSRELSSLEIAEINLDQRITDLKADWFRTHESQMAFKPESCCPTCGQDIPESARDTARAEYNHASAVKKKEINEQGQATAASLAETKRRIEELEKQIEVAGEKERELTAKIAEEKAKDLTTDERLTDAKAAIKMAASLIEAIKTKLAEAEAGQIDNEAIARAEARAGEINALMAESRARIATVEASQKAQDRKAELEAEQKALQVEAEKIEGELYLVDQFTRAKVSGLEGRINSMFSEVPGLTFKMFHTALNGNIEPCCDVIVNGVPFNGGLNNGHCIRAGMGIIGVLSQLIGISICCFVDNAESVTVIPDIGCQVILLVVSAEDKNLRVEILK